MNHIPAPCYLPAVVPVTNFTSSPATAHIMRLVLPTSTLISLEPATLVSRQLALPPTDLGQGLERKTICRPAFDKINHRTRLGRFERNFEKYPASSSKFDTNSTLGFFKKKFVYRLKIAHHSFQDDCK